ncbi:MAG: polysaccharide deacetylase family protein [Solirubrobacterales bacterium]|nr:polysaccharide deacetylase family protein [Solirubrobacterales bacterium]
MAFYLAVNVEWFPAGRPAISLFEATAGAGADPLNYGWRDYGSRVGIWRLMEALDERRLPVSAPLNSAVCQHYPQIVQAGTTRGWCWVAHGRDNSTFHTDMAEAEERALLHEMLEVITEATGTRPQGWLGPALTETFRTPSLLSEFGVRYVMDWCNDDEPYRLAVEPGPLIALPYLCEVSDIPIFLWRGGSADTFARAVIDHFDRLYEEGARRPSVMGLGVHPFLIGQPGRIGGLERALDHIASHPDVWLATSDEIADWYIAGQLAVSGQVGARRND